MTELHGKLWSSPFCGSNFMPSGTSIVPQCKTYQDYTIFVFYCFIFTAWGMGFPRIWMRLGFSLDFSFASRSIFLFMLAVGLFGLHFCLFLCFFSRWGGGGDFFEVITTRHEKISLTACSNPNPPVLWGSIYYYISNNNFLVICI